LKAPDDGGGDRDDPDKLVGGDHRPCEASSKALSKSPRVIAGVVGIGAISPT
jgi:hypothetical protein